MGLREEREPTREERERELAAAAAVPRRKSRFLQAEGAYVRRSAMHGEFVAKARQVPHNPREHAELHADLY